MNTTVDVLEVMNCAAETLVRMKGAGANPRLVNVQRDALIEARAAVAELIETSAAALQYMRLHRYADQAWADDLAAALARVQGGSA